LKNNPVQASLLPCFKYNLKIHNLGCGEGRGKAIHSKPYLAKHSVW